MGAQMIAIEDGIAQCGIFFAEYLQYVVDGLAGNIKFVLCDVTAQTTKEL